MPKKTEPLLSMELKPSKQFKQLLALLHALALGAGIASALPLTVKLALLAGIVVHFYWVARRTQAARCRIRHSDALDWEIDGGSGFRPVQILGSTVITTFAIFLHIRDAGQKRSLLIANDSLSEDDYRQLIVRLKTTFIASSKQR